MSTTSLDSSLIQKWITDKSDIQSIEQHLTVLGHDEASVANYIKEFRKIKNAKRQFNGFICLIVGALLGLSSCVLTLTNPIPGLYNWILFGLTSVSIFLICLGLYYIFE